MSKETTVFRIFLASPSDVDKERQILGKVVSELNQTWSNSLGVTLELLKWETHVHPSSSTYPQAVVNEQIGQEYDAFIGIFWGKIGTPTDKAISGSVEEFELAYARRKANSKVPELMIYFKETPIEPSKIDISQLAAVQNFKGSMSQKGVFYSQFSDTFSFESSIRSHLSAIAQRFAINHGKFIPAHKQVSSNINTTDHEFDQQDYLEVHISRAKRVTNAYRVITEAGNDFSVNLNTQTKKIESMKIYDEAKVKIISFEYVNATKKYSDVLKTQIPLASNSRKIGLDALSKMLSFSNNSIEYFSKLLEMKKTFNEQLNVIQKLQSSVLNMKLIMENSSDGDLNFQDARKVAAVQVGILFEELKSYNFNLVNMVSSIEKIVDRK